MTIEELLLKIKKIDDLKLADFISCLGTRKVEKVKIYLLTNPSKENNQLYAKLEQITDETYASKLRQFISLIKAGRTNELLEVLTLKEKYELLMELEFTNCIREEEKQLPLSYLEQSIESTMSKSR